MENHIEKTSETIQEEPSQQQRGDNSTSRMELKEENEENVVKCGETGATVKERGKYKQYEDSQIMIEKIRSYRTQRYPDSEIMKLLDNMPRRTYYNYVKKLQEQDSEIIARWMEEHEEQVSEEMVIYRETLCQKLREVQAIINSKDTSAKDKMQAIQQQIAISEKLVNFTAKVRPGDIKAAKRERYNLY